MIFRAATAADLAAVVALISGDPLGRDRDPGVVDERYVRAFQEIEADPANLLVVGQDGPDVVACTQLTFIPGLSRHGMRRCLVEAVRVRADRRGAGVGRQLMTWAIDLARARGCGLVQLTSDKQRVDAHRFYASLGFVRSHEGMKLHL